MSKRLHKSNKNRMICGVCGGIAEYFNVDPTIVRLAVALIALFKGAGLLLYIIAAIIIPSDMDMSSDEDVENLKSANLNQGEEAEKTAPHSDEEFNAYFNEEKSKK